MDESVKCVKSDCYMNGIKNMSDPIKTALSLVPMVIEQLIGANGPMIFFLVF